MELISTIIPPMPKADAVPSYDELVRMRVDSYNSMHGTLQGYECSECRNKGYIAKIVDDEEVMATCKCMRIRQTLRRIKESGLETQLKEYTFRSYETKHEWQQRIKDAAAAFVKSDAVGFFIGGQSGCGKTHICTAVIGHMIKQGKSARYFVWRDDSVILKSLANTPEYTDRMNEFKRADVLYIDDLFKGDDVTAADKKLAFELIDYRVRQHLKTIISTELQEDELISCDEATAGRIFQMSRGFRLSVPKDRKKNYRLK